MINLIKKLWPRKQADIQFIASALSKKERYGIDNLEDDVIGYPPDQKGIPVVQNKVLIERLTTDINVLKNEIGLTEKEFDKYLTPVIIEFIKYAHLLPASEYHHHSTGGGLIYHSLDVAKRSMRMAQISEFPVSIGNIGDTQQSNLQWKTATVLAGLLHDCGKIVTDMTISNGLEGRKRIEWDAYGENTITEWAFENDLKRYFISWTKNRNKAHLNASVAVLQKLIPRETMSWLDSCYDGKTIHSTILSTVSSASASHVMSKIVASADSKSLRQDMFNRNSHITKEMKRTPISIILSDLLKHFIITGKWEINKKNAKVWFVDDELYFLWFKVVPELLAELEKAGYEVPDSPDILARVMIEEGVSENYNEDELYHPIQPEILGDKSKPQRLMCLKYSFPAKVIKDPSKLYSISQHKEKLKKKPVSNEKVTTEAKLEQIDYSEEIADVQDETIEQPEYIESGRVSVMRLIKSAAKENVIANNGHENNSTETTERLSVQIKQPGTKEGVKIMLNKAKQKN
ncbi:MobH family relaxase [Psychromonas sp. KJ10-2]|uniref:MobH family relaxase n=1 Tax=Psychromonas sp. KJ10-2 TaxID=3391822 RepID=UPI0039B52A70